MKRTKLQPSGISVSRLGLGCMGMSDFYGSFNDDESIRVIHRSIDLGMTFLDTADAYGPFTNEALVGKAIRGKRDQVTLATKFGIVRDPNDPMKRGFNGKPDYVKSSCEGSLKRLNTDVIDLYYLHRKDPDTSIEETVGAMADLVKQGKIRAIGLSEVSPETLRKAHAVHPITAVQTEYSLWSRDPEDEILKTCRDLGISFVAYSPLGRGFLTGQIKRFEDLEASDYRRHSPRFQGDNFEKNLEVVKRIGEMAKEKGCTTSQLALAWVMAQGDFIFPIPGTKKMKFLEENAKSTEVKLSVDDLALIEEMSPKGFASGARYPENMIRSLNR